jgi:hypothetical protein
MNNVLEIFVGMVSIIFDQVNVIVSFLSDPGFVLGAGSSLVLALAVIGEVRSDTNSQLRITNYELRITNYE